MKTTASEFAIERIVVALDPSMPCRAALNAATELASAFGSELTALLVEDINLVRWAELPMACHFRHFSDRAEPVNAITLSRGLRVQAARVRQLLELAAQRARVHYSVREVRGQVTEELLAAARDSDLLIVGRASRTRTRRVRLGSTALAVAEQAPRTVLLLQRGHLAGRPLIAVFDGSDGSEHALSVAATLLQFGFSDLTVLALVRQPERMTSLKKTVEGLLESLELKAKVQFLQEPDLEALANRVRGRADGVIVLAKDLRVFRREPIQKLLDQVDNPVFVVR